MQSHDSKNMLTRQKSKFFEYMDLTPQGTRPIIWAEKLIERGWSLPTITKYYHDWEQEAPVAKIVTTSEIKFPFVGIVFAIVAFSFMYYLSVPGWMCTDMMNTIKINNIEIMGQYNIKNVIIPWSPLQLSCAVYKELSKDPFNVTTNLSRTIKLHENVKFEGFLYSNLKASLYINTLIPDLAEMIDLQSLPANNPTWEPHHEYVLQAWKERFNPNKVKMCAYLENNILNWMKCNGSEKIVEDVHKHQIEDIQNKTILEFEQFRHKPCVSKFMFPSFQHVLCENVRYIIQYLNDKKTLHKWKVYFVTASDQDFIKIFDKIKHRCEDTVFCIFRYKLWYTMLIHYYYIWNEKIQYFIAGYTFNTFI